jgi:hypothetical protein
MGLFDDTLRRYGGTFYRQFSQAYGSPDLEHHFGDESVAERGICAGSCLDWIEHYLSTPNQRYSNQIMSQNRQKIVTIQRALRFRDQSLLDLLVLYGFLPAPNGLLLHDVDSLNDSEYVAVQVIACQGIHVVSYNDPAHGRHVAVCYVRPRDKMMYFMDVHKGDVEVPYPRSAAWLKAYFDIFIARCGSIQVSSLQPVWNAPQARQAYRAVVRDSLRFDARALGIHPRHRPRDDAHDVVGFRARGRLDGLL